MRTQEEYKAEVLLRAEQGKQKHKKNRKRILTACTSFLLICVVGVCVWQTAVPKTDVYDLAAYQISWPDLYTWLTYEDGFAAGNVQNGTADNDGQTTGALTEPTTDNRSLSIVRVELYMSPDGDQMPYHKVVLTERYEIKKLCDFLQKTIAQASPEGDGEMKKDFTVVFVTETGDEYRLRILGNRLIEGPEGSVYLPDAVLEKFRRKYFD